MSGIGLRLRGDGLDGSGGMLFKDGEIGETLAMPREELVWGGMFKGQGQREPLRCRRCATWKPSKYYRQGAGNQIADLPKPQRSYTDDSVASSVFGINDWIDRLYAWRRHVARIKRTREQLG